MFGSRQSSKTRLTAPRLRVTPHLQLLDERDVPTVIAVPDFYVVRAGQTLTVPVNQGVLANDFSSTNPGAILVAELKAGPTLTQPPAAPALPANALELELNGSFTFTAPSNINPANSPVTFVYQARDITNGETTETTVTINVTGAATALYAVGSGPGQTAEVKVFDSASGLQRFSLNPYGGFTGGVRVATGDINQDGVDDIVTAPDVGGSALVRVFDGKTGSQLGAFFAFEPDFRGGGYVSVGDVDGDLVKDIIVGAGVTGGPRVQVYSLNAGGLLTFGLPPIVDYFAYESTFRNGVNVASGDLDGDGLDEIVTGAGPGGGPAIKVYGAAELFSGFPDIPAQKAFFAFNSNNRGGVNVAVGQFRGDGKADIVAGSGNGSALVRVFDGRSTAVLREFVVTSSDNPVGGQGSGGLSGAGGNLLPGVGLPNGLSPGATSGFGAITGGARVAVTDRSGDGLSDIVVGQGIGNAPRVRIFDGNSLTELSNNLIFNSLFAGGVYVGGNSLELG
jgi:hypothetical protein